ncbi:hypothetical protein ASG87_05660 [Frateuria sp. Soil773]|nr:hypothetical protein ASG87_05660 [Frateuria sp. Soil773]
MGRWCPPSTALRADDTYRLVIDPAFQLWSFVMTCIVLSSLLVLSGAVAAAGLRRPARLVRTQRITAFRRRHY